MSIEQVIRAWKADEDDQATNVVANPVGEELTEQELQEVIGGFCPVTIFCVQTCLDGTVPVI